jgi:hypothetical protein
MMAKIYKYVHIYRVRVTELQCSCYEAENGYRILLHRANTRFPSLFSAIGSFVEMVSSLSAYFISQPKYSSLVRNLFQNESSKFCLLFVLSQSDKLITAIRLMQP